MPEEEWPYLGAHQELRRQAAVHGPIAAFCAVGGISDHRNWVKEYKSVEKTCYCTCGEENRNRSHWMWNCLDAPSSGIPGEHPRCLLEERLAVPCVQLPNKHLTTQVLFLHSFGGPLPGLVKWL